MILPSLKNEEGAVNNTVHVPLLSIALACTITQLLKFVFTFIFFLSRALFNLFQSIA